WVYGVEAVLAFEQLTAIGDGNQARPVGYERRCVRLAELGPAVAGWLIGKLESFEAQFGAADPAGDERADDNRYDERQGDDEPRDVRQHGEAGHGEEEGCGRNGDQELCAAFHARSQVSAEIFGRGR